MRARRAAALLLAATFAVGACQTSATPAPTISPSGSFEVSSRSGSPGPTAATSATASPEASASPALYAPSDGLAALAYPRRTVFVQMFEWRWTDIAKECEQWLGPRGFAAVQVSPPQEAAVIDDGTNVYPWWQRYQPVSYKIESRSGTRAEFRDMAARCRAAGVEVYADVILNHMASGSGTGNAGTTFTKYTFPGLYVPADFHANPNPAYPKILCDHSIDSSDPANVQTCELGGLPDLRTEEPKVQEAEASYLADLYSLGVRGFRIDAAKHIDHLQLAAILARFRGKIGSGATVFIDQEVTDFGGDAVAKDGYYGLGSVDDFVYAADLTAGFMHTDETVSSLRDLPSEPYVTPSGNSVVFVDNHDTQRGHIGNGILLSYKRQDLYTLANVFMLAYPLGYPRVMSSFVFDDTEAGPPSDATGHTNSIYTGNVPNCGLSPGQWVCEQRWQAIAGMVGFRDFTAGSTSVTDWWSNPADGNQVAFGRGGGATSGSTGFVVINRSQSTLEQTLQTGLGPGSYCDVVGGALLATGTCSGPTITVAAGGTATFRLAPMTAVAIHVGARPGK